VKAIILAAGVARRLAPLTDRTPKCLLPLGDSSLLARMLGALDDLGVRAAVVVVGHCAEQVRAAADRWGHRLVIDYVDNPDYRRGSALSLWAARAHLAGPVLIMDADVLFPRELLRRLLAAPAPSAFALDRGFVDTGEEVKYYAQGERVVALGKRVTPPRWEVVGEGVGFFKCGPAAAPLLREALAQVVAADPDAEYEDALHRLVQRHPVGWVDVTGLPWTEVDFPEDLRRAREEVLPRVARLDAA